MRTCHLLSLVAAVSFGVVCVDTENQSGSDVIDKAEGVIEGNVAEAGDLASVSLLLQYLRVPQTGGRKTIQRTRLTS